MVGAFDSWKRGRAAMAAAAEVPEDVRRRVADEPEPAYAQRSGALVGRVHCTRRADGSGARAPRRDEAHA